MDDLVDVDLSYLGTPEITEFEEGPLEKIIQFSNPILGPDFSRGFKHVRNPGAIKLEGTFYLFPTIHCKDKKNRIYRAVSKDGINFKIDYEPFIEPSKPGEPLYGNDFCGDEDIRIVRGPDGKIEGYFTLFKEYGTKRKWFKKKKIKWITTRVGWGYIDSKIEKFTKKGILFDNLKNNKNAAASSKIVNGSRHYYHRAFENPFEEKTLPAIWCSSTGDPERKLWDRHEIIARPRKDYWDSVRIGIGPPPIETKKGFFMTYHGANEKNEYAIGHLMLNLENPAQINSRCKEAIMKPIFEWHKKGEVNNVVFLNGWVPINERIIYAYPSGADSHIGFAIFKMREGYEIMEHEYKH